ncbi:hypothetical protein IC582_005206 [Cucumis melo]
MRKCTVTRAWGRGGKGANYQCQKSSTKLLSLWHRELYLGGKENMVHCYTIRRETQTSSWKSRV